MPRLLLGFTGKRLAGKTRAAGFITKNYAGWMDVHAFNPGKEMVHTYYTHLGIPTDLASELVHGEHKDTLFADLFCKIRGQTYCLSDIIPGPNSRFLMERFGKFLGKDIEPTMQAEFTLIAELKRVERLFPEQNVVVQSLVYEVDKFRARGGLVVKVVRPDQQDDGLGIESDAFVDAILPDIWLMNDGTLDDLKDKVDKLLIELGAFDN